MAGDTHPGGAGAHREVFILNSSDIKDEEYPSGYSSLPFNSVTNKNCQHSEDILLLNSEVS
jgi:hypothetical protein